MSNGINVYAVAAYFRKIAGNWWYGEQNTFQEMKFVGAEVTICDSRNVKTKPLTYIPINDTPREYLMNQCMQPIYIRISFCFKSKPTEIYHYYFENDEKVVFPIPFTVPYYTDWFFIEIYLWKQADPENSVNVTDILKQWSGPFFDFFGKNAPPLCLIWSDIPDESKQWYLYIFDSNCLCWFKNVDKTTRLNWPPSTNTDFFNITYEEFEVAKSLLE